jgi:hypothetical protein
MSPHAISKTPTIVIINTKFAPCRTTERSAVFVRAKTMHMRIMTPVNDVNPPSAIFSLWLIEKIGMVSLECLV